MRNTLILLLLLGTGCAVYPSVPTYAGPRRKPNETASLRAYGAWARSGLERSIEGGIDITEVDGITAPYRGNVPGLTVTKALEVLPGPHTVTIRWSRRYFGLFVSRTRAHRPEHGAVSLQFNAEAGRSYFVEFTDMKATPPRFEVRSEPRRLFAWYPAGADG